MRNFNRIPTRTRTATLEEWLQQQEADVNRLRRAITHSPGLGRVPVAPEMDANSVEMQIIRLQTIRQLKAKRDRFIAHARRGASRRTPGTITVPLSLVSSSRRRADVHYQWATAVLLLLGAVLGIGMVSMGDRPVATMTAGAR